jgi:hypothetical protein
MPAEVVGMGGTVPITTTFRDALGVDTVFFSFSTADEDIHAPNEFYRLERVRLGLQGWARLWRTLADTWTGRGAASRTNDARHRQGLRGRESLAAGG